MAFIKRENLQRETSEDALKIVCGFFQIDNLYEEQKTILRQFFLGKTVFFSAGTGYGKSLIFQAVPLLADLLIDQAIGTSIAIVISPLVSLMLEQVAYLKSIGFSAAAVFEGQYDQVLKDIIEEGIYSHIYVSPESMLSVQVQRWRRMLQSPHFKTHCVVVAVDEAHCISQW
ncbi:ATP-dependent DNA helicase -like [Paramuricea clavata]|uniref:ATP-dependent DNA helicase -like n=1 Tax=Paramuricea clavata TaxID=317549 RepID=A0A7D9L890_PARCT|nr:ATP-dependent DNA helicase -like [Paramuricea clavata]